LFDDDLPPEEKKLAEQRKALQRQEEKQNMGSENQETVNEESKR
jgi:hypothetical protein